MKTTAASRRPSRDAAATRRRILEAATREFSAFGLAGARTNRIAHAAQANQRMLYAYFGNKDGLFDAVLEHHIVLARDAVHFDPADLPGYAQRVFDFYHTHPSLVRLAMWQSLERPNLMESFPEAKRAMAEKIDGVTRLQRAGVVNSSLSAERLLDTILTLAQGSITVAGRAELWSDDQRRDLGISVTALVAPNPTPPPTI